MTEELQALADITSRLESAGIEYMLTGSMAMLAYAVGRATQDLDLVVAFYIRDAARISEVLGSEYYVSEVAARDAVMHQSSFNVIYKPTMIKTDFLIRKREEYRLHEFERRQKMSVDGVEVWVASKEDVILSKLEWARHSLSERQHSDVVNLIASGCDMEYIRLWSTRLNLTDMLTRVSP